MYDRPPIQVHEQRKPGVAPHTITKEQSKKVSQTEAARDTVSVKQPYDAFLVVDVEATCLQGAGFEWPNEIIEWPVCLLRWKDKSPKGKASQLEIVDEFRSFVRPTWRPQLSQFCTDLTGITQAQVNHAPTFPKVIEIFARFLAQHGLIDPKNGRPLQRFCWCSDGPFDVRDFVVKQCFISNIPMPSWLKGDVLDVRRLVSIWVATNEPSDSQQIRTRLATSYHFRSLNIPQQLRALGLAPFQGRLHCGIDDTRNITRVIIEIARRGIRLEPNTTINPNRRWQWMGRPGEVLEYCLI
ncbi:ribonuclease H-like domain-containing protein [Melanogaster broomeanus]|nr:ribonuclease H-like domain-containing protein [Melanogaster broomeanus]